MPVPNVTTRKEEPQPDDRNDQRDRKKIVLAKWDGSKKFWMSPIEYTGVVAGKDAIEGAYVITDGEIGPGGIIPDHYHKWEDQIFHVVQGQLEAKIGDETAILSPGDSVCCPRGVSHYMKNIGDEEARLISCTFPGDWAESFMAETSRQNHEDTHNPELIERRIGVVYL